MSNSIEKFRIEPDESAQGGWVFFDWSSGSMSAVWDDGGVETWNRTGYTIDQRAESFFMLTDQWDRSHQ